MNEIKRPIKYEADRVVGLGREVPGVVGCGRLGSCIHCNTPCRYGLANSLILRKR